MSNDTTQLSTDLLDALRAEERVPMPQAVRGRLEGRLSAAALAASPDPSGRGAAGTAAARSGWLQSSGLMLALALPVGAALGAAGHAWLSRPAAVPPPAGAATPIAVTASAAAAAEPPAALAVEALAPEPASEPRSAVAAAVNPPPRSGAVSAPSPSGERASAAASLTGDLELLEQARTQLAESNAALTLSLLRAHQQRYPQSALREEREALTIRALRSAGRSSEASRRADAFLQRYPQSVLREAVAGGAGKIP